MRRRLIDACRAQGFGKSCPTCRHEVTKVPWDSLQEPDVTDVDKEGMGGLRSDNDGQLPCQGVRKPVGLCLHVLDSPAAAFLGILRLHELCTRKPVQHRQIQVAGRSLAGHVEKPAQLNTS